MTLGLLILALMACVLAGCGSSAGDPRVAAVPATSTMDQPIGITLSGLAPGEKVTVDLSSTDHHGVAWRSSATFAADSAGRVDLSRQSPLAGSYRGRNPMGLVESLRAPPGTDTPYAWGATAAQQFVVRVMAAGRSVATTTFTRRVLDAGVTVRAETLAATGFIGRYYTPAVGTVRRRAVMVFGGSEGGLAYGDDLLGPLLADDGYPTLAVAYFALPGLPAQLAKIPLTYFTGALRWLARQPGVDPNGISVMSASRGTEAALLLGADFPNLVHGVIVSAPADDVNCSYPARPCRPTWTLNGAAVPYTQQWDNPHPTDNPAAVIPVGHIDEPVFMDCGTADPVWDSCAYSAAIMAHLDATGDPYPHCLSRYAGAGHYENGLIPYQPGMAEDGTTPLANAVADAHVWPKLLAFLTDPAGCAGTTTTAT